MKITFVLPFSGHRPVGGFKVVYEYANGLVRRGHEVTVLHAPYARLETVTPLLKARGVLAYLARRAGFCGGYKPGQWFTSDPLVRHRWLPSLRPLWVPPADVVVATAWETAEWVAGYPAVKGKKFYLIQHQESGFDGVDPDRVMATWKFPLEKIVIARWLQDIASTIGEKADYIPNGLDFGTFNIDVPVADREQGRLIMLYHGHDWKGSRDGIEAMTIARKQEPNIRATLFGVPPQPDGLPSWITYVRKPAQSVLRRLYNEASIFVGPSWAEGWPLPPAEAAQCGAALCLTDIGGHREYGIHGETALLSPVKDPEALAENILRLVADRDTRVRLAEQGHEFICRFTWERAVTSLEGTLRDVVWRR